MIDKRGSIFRIKPSSIFHDPFGISVIGESNQSMKFDTSRLKSFSNLKKSFEKNVTSSTSSGIQLYKTFAENNPKVTTLMCKIGYIDY